MELEFDPDKDAANLVKHGVSLARVLELQVFARVVDNRFSEPRMRAYGVLDGLLYCLAYTQRGDRVRAISLRRARFKEVRRYVPI